VLARGRKNRPQRPRAHLLGLVPSGDALARPDGDREPPLLARARGVEAWDALRRSTDGCFNDFRRYLMLRHRSTQIEEQESKKHVGFAREGSRIVALLGLVGNDFRL